MTKPTLILDPHWRQMRELFSETSLAQLHGMFDIVWGQDAPIPADVLAEALPRATALIAATPQITAETLAQAPNLKAIIEVSGAFPDTIDYGAAQARGIEVLSCSPGFRASVAEMGLAMALGAGRGLVREHEAFRTGTETWLEDRADVDFTMFGARVGFVGFGQIAQEMTRLLAPFGPEIRAFDPWLPSDVARDYGVTLAELQAVAAWAQCLFVTAVPTAENTGLISAEVMAAMPDKALLVVLSRAHLVDFDALTAEAATGRLRVATDVFPAEPLAAGHPIRQVPDVILSPHRAAAVDRGRQLIGDMIAHDLGALIAGRPDRQLSRADPARIAQLTGVGDAQQVADMAGARAPS